MVPIGSAIPVNAAGFQAAIEHGLAPFGLREGAVVLEGDFPRLDALRLDLTGARFDRRSTGSRAATHQEALCFIRALHASGQPIYVEDVPVELALHADDVVLAAADAADGTGKVAVFQRAGGGKLELSVKRADLERALFSAGQEAASSKGAEVKSVNLQLESQGQRALAIRATVEAKAIFFTTTVVVSGVAEIDDQLNARLRDLQCDGDGMIGKMAAGVLRPKFEQLQERVFPLGGAVRGFALRNVTVSGGEELRIAADFASAT